MKFACHNFATHQEQTDEDNHPTVTFWLRRCVRLCLYRPRVCRHYRQQHVPQRHCEPYHRAQHHCNFRHRAITALSASIAVSHTYVGDLTYILRHGDVTVWLMSQPGAAMDESGFGNSATLSALTPLEFSDAPGLPSADTVGAGCIFGETAGVTAACAATAYRSLDPMSAFDGRALFGDWTLTIIDSAEGDEGVLSGWSLSDAGAAVPEPATLALFILALSAMSAVSGRHKMPRAVAAARHTGDDCPALRHTRW